MKQGLYLGWTLVLASAAIGAELPERFPLAAPAFAIRKPAQPVKFMESVGRRAMLLGREDGTFEAWVNPVKVLRDFRLSAYFDGSLEPVPLSDLAEVVEAAPGRSTVVHSHAAFTVRQTWIAALDRPALVVLLDIDTDRPLRLRASFVPELKPMWPASFGGQSSSFDEGERAFILGEGLRKWYAVVGCPLFSKTSEQVGHQLPDRTVVVEMEVTPEIARRRLVPIVIAGSGEGAEAARRVYREELARIAAEVAESDAYYSDFATRTMTVDTPLLLLNGAFKQAQFAIEKGWQCDAGVGCGLVAGFAPSGASERPGFAWFFGGDAFMNSWAIVDYGDFARARGVLEFFRGRQRADGKLPHELTQSLALLDWSKYPYGYYHGDTTGLYLIAADYYVRRSGDLQFLRESWPSVQRAYAFLAGAADPDGLLSNRAAGTAAVETGALAGKVVKDVYLQGVWIASLRAYEAMADHMLDTAASAQARARRAKAVAALEGWFQPARGWLAFGALADGSVYDAQSSWQSFALAYGGLSDRVARPSAARLSRPELSTPWGTRLFATDSPFYDPLGYNDGSVWPFVTAFAAMAEFRNGQHEAGLRHLFGVASMTGVSGAGFLSEYFSGERAQALPRSVPHQLFSSMAVVHPLVSGLLGLEGSGVDRTVSVRPRVPLEWRRSAWHNYRVGPSTVRGEITSDGGIMTVNVAVDGPPLDIEVAPDFGGPPQRCSACKELRAVFRTPLRTTRPVELRAPEIGQRAVRQE